MRLVGESPAAGRGAGVGLGEDTIDVVPAGQDAQVGPDGAVGRPGLVGADDRERAGGRKITGGGPGRDRATAAADDVEQPDLVVVGGDVRLLVDVRVEEHPTLLEQDSAVPLRRVERPAGEVAVHVVPLDEMVTSCGQAGRPGTEDRIPSSGPTGRNGSSSRAAARTRTGRPR